MTHHETWSTSSILADLMDTLRLEEHVGVAIPEIIPAATSDDLSSSESVDSPILSDKIAFTHPATPSQEIQANDDREEPTEDTNDSVEIQVRYRPILKKTRILYRWRKHCIVLTPSPTVKITTPCCAFVRKWEFKLKTTTTCADMRIGLSTKRCRAGMPRPIFTCSYSPLDQVSGYAYGDSVSMHLRYVAFDSWNEQGSALTFLLFQHSHNSNKDELLSTLSLAINGSDFKIIVPWVPCQKYYPTVWASTRRDSVEFLGFIAT